MIRKLKSVYCVAADMARAVAFYREALGLPVRFQDGARWTQFDAQGGGFALSSAEEAAPGARGATPVFEVADLDAAAAAITRHGGTVLDRRDMGSHGATLAFRDTEGNLLQLFQSAPRVGT